MVVGEDLELGVEIEVQVDKAGKGSSRVARGERLEAVVDGVGITSADVAGKVNLLEALGIVLVLDEGGIGLADGQEMGPQATNQPLEEDLEDGGGDERVE